MQYYLIENTVIPCTPEELTARDGKKVVAVMTPEEWKSEQGQIRMGIELDPLRRDIHSTKAEVNYGALTLSLIHI